MLQLLDIHGSHLISILGLLGFLEGIVLERNNHILLTECDLLELQRSVPIGHIVGFLIIYSAKQLESQIILRLGHLQHSRISESHAGVALS